MVVTQYVVAVDHVCRYDGNALFKVYSGSSHGRGMK